MKKALPLLLSILLAFGLVLTAGALTLEDVETAQDLSASPIEENALTYEEAASDVAMPPLLDSTYGMLLFYQSFDKGTDDPDYIAEGLTYSSTTAGEGSGAAKAIVDNPDDS
ncbi:MAG: hypothetical protein ACI4RV_05365, partial [Eubacteriales bacterium]